MPATLRVLDTVFGVRAQMIRACLRADSRLVVRVVLPDGTHADCPVADCHDEGGGRVVDRDGGVSYPPCNLVLSVVLPTGEGP